MSLSASGRQRILKLMDKIKIIGESISEPVDPKVEACLEIAFRLLEEQIDLQKVYEYDRIQNMEDKFIYLDDDTPDADELNNWLNGE